MKEGISIRHLLTMTAGMEWDESTYPYTDLRNDIVRFSISPDPLRFILDRKVAAAPLGMLVLNGGVWNGQQVVSRGWLELSMQNAAKAGPDSGYGFMWWLPVLPEPAAKAIGPVYMASGWGGQYIVIASERKIVLVLTGGNYYFQAPDIIEYFLKSVFL